MSDIEILCVNEQGSHITACAARISTIKGGARALFDERSGDDDKLIGKVLKSGHSSITEHIYFNLAISASSIAEQFFIEFRLASFTVKSRRYVDFSGAGRYKPTDMPSGFEALTERCFTAYEELIASSVAKEDARFVLPRCFISEFYLSCNARELIYIISRMNTTEELRELKGQLLSQLQNCAPAVFNACAAAPIVTANDIKAGGDKRLGNVTLLSRTENPKTLLNACGVKDIAAYAAAPRPRALEHIVYTFAIDHITFAGLTHLTRHRMLSLSVSDKLDFGYYLNERLAPLLPDKRCGEIFERAFEASAEYAALCPGDIAEYSALCGHVTNVIVTMNARELLLFFKLRLCNRAQWEIREIAETMLYICRKEFGELFNSFGPGCYSAGACPEGRLSCGQMKEVIKAYGRFE